MAAAVWEGVYGSSGVGSVWQQWLGECMAAVVWGVYGSSGVGSGGVRNGMYGEMSVQESRKNKIR